MRVSVVIPTYNSAGFIQATLDSVLAQTLPAHEILVLDDGSTDETLSVLRSYRPRIIVITQKNGGVACARNRLCNHATGDLIAFLDHDDLWHPDYLQSHVRIWRENPTIVGSFLGHVDFQGYDGFKWESRPLGQTEQVKLLDPESFLRSYNDQSGLFGSASFLCVSKKTVQAMGNNPFCEEVTGVDDGYFCTILPLLGPVAYWGAPLAAYRITDSAQSNNKLKAFQMWAHIFRLLDARYRTEASPELYKAFRECFASKRRQFAKRLMGAGRISEARAELWQSSSTHKTVGSWAKSLSLFALTFLPATFQPKWPAPYREVRGALPGILQHQR